jgi:Arc/MetJ family transcription regulator
MSRTNIDIDDQLVETVMRRYGLTTKKDAVDLALRRLAGQPMTTDEVLAMQGANLIAVNVRELSRDDL